MSKSKIDFSDAVFMIPVRIDGQQRKRHLLFILDRILSNFSANIMLYEDDKTAKVSSEVPKSLFSQCKYKFFQNRKADASFRKSMLLNEMMIDSSQAILIPHDSEVFLNPIVAYQQAVQMVREGVCGGCIPHSVCKRYDVKSEAFYKKCDFRHLRHTKDYPMNVGGILMLNRNMVLSCGMWNQDFTTWGDEDTEFMNRLKRFGYQINRMKCPIFHLNHPKKSTGFYSKDYLQNKKHCKKINSMSSKDILKMIEGWSWVRRASEISK